MTTVEPVEVKDHAAQAQEFLQRARTYLANGDLHQASEKGWGAASHMAKAVAAANGWVYESHRDFSRVLNEAWLATRDHRIRRHRATPNNLHENFYTRARFLHADTIAWDLADVEELIEALAPLTELSADRDDQP